MLMGIVDPIKNMWQDVKRIYVRQNRGQTLRMPDNRVWSRTNVHTSNSAIISSCFPFLCRMFFSLYDRFHMWCNWGFVHGLW